MIHRVRNVQMPGGIEQDRFRSVQHRLGGRFAVAVVAEVADSRYRRHDPRLHVDFPDTVAPFIGNIHITLRIHSDAYRIVEPHLGPWFSIIVEHIHVHAVSVAGRPQPSMIVAEIYPDGIAGQHDKILGDQRTVPDVIFMGPGSGDGGDQFGLRIVHPDAMRLRIHDKQTVLGIEGNPARIGEVGFQGRSVPVKAEFPGSDDRVDDARLHIDAPDPVASGVADVEIALRVERNVKGQVQPGLRGRAPISAVAGFADARHVADDARGEFHPSDPIASRFREIQILSLRINCETHR